MKRIFCLSHSQHRRRGKKGAATDPIEQQEEESREKEAEKWLRMNSTLIRERERERGEFFQWEPLEKKRRKELSFVCVPSHNKLSPCVRAVCVCVLTGAVSIAYEIGTQ